MNLRRLKYKDASLMLEWMHDKSVVAYLKNDFLEKKLVDCEDFIRDSLTDKENLHLAVIDDMDIYMGTVSLKHITKISAEFAITVRRSVMGKGYSRYAMKEIIHIGLEKMGLQYIYWYVSPDNKRAIRFYDKNGYKRVDPSLLDMPCQRCDEVGSYIWYIISESDKKVKC